jgi:hypothetical protein
LVEDPPHLRQEAGQLPGELRPLFGSVGKVQQLLTDQLVKRALHAEAPLDSLRRLALLDPDLLESDGHSPVNIPPAHRGSQLSLLASAPQRASADGAPHCNDTTTSKVNTVADE